MANYMCKFCEQNPASFLVAEVSTGETAYICLACFPPFISATWEDAGLPELTFDVPEPPPEGPGVLEQIEADEAADKKEARSRKNGKTPEAPEPEPTTEETPVTHV